MDAVGDLERAIRKRNIEDGPSRRAATVRIPGRWNTDHQRLPLALCVVEGRCAGTTIRDPIGAGCRRSDTDRIDEVGIEDWCESWYVGNAFRSKYGCEDGVRHGPWRPEEKEAEDGHDGHEAQHRDSWGIHRGPLVS
jgi:hypothetical protein